MENHLATFSPFLLDRQEPFLGTVIRLPLRTSSQAARSSISSCETTIDMVIQEVSTFARDFGSSGMLFLKHLECLQFDITGSAPVKIEIVNTDDVRSHRKSIKEATGSLASSDFGFQLGFDVHVKFESSFLEDKFRYAVSHAILTPATSRLSDWGRQNRFSPWAAVAVLTSHDINETGRVYTCLPLPIRTAHYAHIHGQFSLTASRNAMHGMDDGMSRSDLGVGWNSWLCDMVLPQAWTELLRHMALTMDLTQSAKVWDLYLPSAAASQGDLFRKTLNQVLKFVKDGRLQVWPTSLGPLSHEEIFLARGDEDQVLIDALQATRTPLLHIAQRLRTHTHELFKDRHLKPKSLYDHLCKAATLIGNIDNGAKLRLLDYLLTDSLLNIERLRLFPLENGSFEALHDRRVFVHRDELDSSLFKYDSACNLDLDKLPVKLQQKFRVLDLSLPSLRHREAKDLKAYFLNFVLRGLDADTIELDDIKTSIVALAQKWTVIRKVDPYDPCLTQLPLLPLSGNRYRRIRPRSSAHAVAIVPEDGGSDLLVSWMIERPQLGHITETSLAGPFGHYINSYAQKPDVYHVYDTRSLTGLIQWLALLTPPGFRNHEERALLSAYVTLRLPTLDESSGDTAKHFIRKLPIFQSLQWSHEESLTTWAWSGIDPAKQIIGLKDGLLAIPELQGFQMLQNKDSSNQLLFSFLKIKSLGTLQVLELVIDAWAQTDCGQWPPAAKMQCAELILRNYLNFDIPTRDRIAHIKLVPSIAQHQLGRQNGLVDPIVRFSAPVDLVSPKATSLHKLYLPDEILELPIPSFANEFEHILTQAGMRTELSQDLVFERISAFSQKNRSVHDVYIHVEALLKSYLQAEIDFSKTYELAWLPVRLPGRERKLALSSVNECFSREYSDLVRHVVPVIDVAISPQWIPCLGPQKFVSDAVLLSQLQAAVELKDHISVDSVLKHISDGIKKGNSTSTTLLDSLRQTRCVLTSNGRYEIPTSCFGGGAKDLQPYLHHTDLRFEMMHGKLLHALGVRKMPTISDLIGVHAAMGLGSKLEEADRTVALKVLKRLADIGSRQDHPEMSKAMVLSSDDILCSINEM